MTQPLLLLSSTILMKYECMRISSLSSGWNAVTSWLPCRAATICPPTTLRAFAEPYTLFIYGARMKVMGMLSPTSSTLSSV